MRQRFLLAIALAALCGALAFSQAAGGPAAPGSGRVRAGKIGGAASISFGKTSGDAAAQLGLGAEYGIGERLVLGLGYAYVDGLHPLQEHCLALYGKAFLLGRRLDPFAELGLQAFLRDEGGIGAVWTAQAGVEWASGAGFVVALSGGASFEPEAIGYLVGGSVGLRF